MDTTSVPKTKTVSEGTLPGFAEGKPNASILSLEAMILISNKKQLLEECSGNFQAAFAREKSTRGRETDTNDDL